MKTESWHAARLIPTSGISGQEEAERRATSALLAVMPAGREFGSAIVRPLGAPAGQLSTFIEVPFKLGDNKVIPDGLVRTSRAGKTWTCSWRSRPAPPSCNEPRWSATSTVFG